MQAPACRVSAPPAPRQEPPPARPAPRHRASWRPARPVRKAEPARRPPRGRAYLVWCGPPLQLAGSTPTAAGLCAPRPDGCCAGPGHGHGHFHFPQLPRQESESENGREAGPRPSAVNAERGLAARGGGSGLGPTRGGWPEPRAPEGPRASGERGPGPCPAGRRAARHQRERPRSAPSFGPAAHRASAQGGRFPGRPSVSACLGLGADGGPAGSASWVSGLRRRVWPGRLGASL